MAKKDLRRRGFGGALCFLVSREGTVASKTFWGCFESNIGYDHVSLFYFFIFFFVLIFIRAT